MPVILLAHTTGWPARIPVALVVTAGAAYLLASRSAGTRTGAGFRRMRRSQRRRAAAYLAGLILVLAALTGPVERYADELFWVHMVQHVLLLAVAAPLFVLAAPWALSLRLLQPNARRRVVAWWRGARSARPLRVVAALLAAPVAAWILFDANLIAWHVPAAFDLTLRSEPAHDVEHVLFLGLGVLFWMQVIDSPSRRPRLGNLQRAAYVTAASAVGWALSIALTIAPSPLYAGYAGAAARPAGVSALADQRLAAGVMLVPGSIPFVVAALVGLIRWLGEDERLAAGRGSVTPVAIRGPEGGA
jgi:putative membrane protein